MVRNGNFTFLLLEFILADEVADLLADLPPVMASSGQEWQFSISTVKCSYWQINWQIYPQYNASWDVYYGMYIGSHCGLFKKRWEFAFISE